MPEKRDFSELWQPPSKKQIDKQGLSNTDLQTANPAKHFLEQSRTQET